MLVIIWRETVFTAGGNVNLYNDCGNQYKVLLKKKKTTSRTAIEPNYVTQGYVSHRHLFT